MSIETIAQDDVSKTSSQIHSELDRQYSDDDPTWNKEGFRGVVFDLQVEKKPLVQGSPEWVARLWNLGHEFQGVPLSEEATSREAFYGEDLR